jgi:hypothetical protein
MTPEAADPLYHQRPEMPVHEFDAVDYFVHEPGRSPAPEPAVLAYFDSGLPLPDLADHLDRITTEMTLTLTATTEHPMCLLQAFWQLRGQTEVNRRAWSDDTHAALGAALRSGRLETAYLLFTAGDHDQHRWQFDLCAYPWPEQAPDAAVTMSLVSLDLWPARQTDVAAEAVLTLLAGWREPLRLRTGGVTVDRGTTLTSPWDAWYGVGNHVHGPLVATHVRGYFWATVLTGGHLERLGGMEALGERAAALGFELSTVDGEAVILRDPGRVTAFDDERLAAMRHLLAPVLLPTPYRLYQGYSLRIIRDTGTAFRRVPPGSPFPRLLPGEGPLPGDDARTPPA